MIYTPIIKRLEEIPLSPDRLLLIQTLAELDFPDYRKEIARLFAKCRDRDLSLKRFRHILHKARYYSLTDLKLEKEAAQWQRALHAAKEADPDLKIALESDGANQIAIIEEHFAEIMRFATPITPPTPEQEANAPLYNFLVSAFEENLVLQENKLEKTIIHHLGLNAFAPNNDRVHLHFQDDAVPALTREKILNAEQDGPEAHSQQKAQDYVRIFNAAETRKSPIMQVFTQLEKAQSYVELLQSIADDLGQSGAWETAITTIFNEEKFAPLSQPLAMADFMQKSFLACLSNQGALAFTTKLNEHLAQAAQATTLPLPPQTLR